MPPQPMVFPLKLTVSPQSGPPPYLVAIPWMISALSGSRPALSPSAASEASARATSVAVDSRECHLLKRLIGAPSSARLLFGFPVKISPPTRRARTKIAIPQELRKLSLRRLKYLG
jgi:hypothetical protein